MNASADATRRATRRESPAGEAGSGPAEPGEPGQSDSGAGPIAGRRGDAEPGDDGETEPDQPPPAGGPGKGTGAGTGTGTVVLVEWQARGPAAAAIDRGWIETRLRAACGLIGRPVRRIGIALLDDAAMIDLHREHCGLDTTTDVLTFPLAEAAEPDAPIEAEIAISLDEAARAARARGRSVESELLLYCLHGLLHCAGYDDHGEAAFARMHAREDEILRAVGVGPLFGEGPRSGEGPQFGDGLGSAGSRSGSASPRRPRGRARR